MSALDLVPASLEDTDRITALLNRSMRHDGIPRTLEAAEMHEEFTARGVDVRRDVRIVLSGGELVGYGFVHHRPSGVGHERAMIHGTVDPAMRGRGIGRSILGWCVEAATERLRAIDNELPKFIRIYEFEQVEDLFRLASHFGFTPVRWFDELLLPLSQRPAAEEPAGIEIVPWSFCSNEEHRRVRNAAFEDHWGSLPNDTESWNAMMTGYGSRLDLSLGAIDKESRELVGSCWNKHYPTDEALLGRRDGWIQLLSTLRPFRGRGIGTSLITHSLRAFERAGFTHGSIGVDSDNPTGASQLYRSIGFEPQFREVVVELRVLQ